LFDREKFKRLVHYVIARAGKRDGFGATKLYKVLWFAEARRWVLTGEPITGAVFVREKFGPVPKLGMQIRNELVSEGKIRQQKMPGEYGEWQFESVQPPALDTFSAEERQIVDHWIRTINEDHTAQSISDESHDFGWEIARMGEELPYHALMAGRRRKATPKEVEWAKEVVKRRKAS
jgi:hypothetical protein